MPTNLLSVPHHKQSHIGACLPACAWMVLAYLGYSTSEVELARRLGTQPYGTLDYFLLAWSEFDHRCATIQRKAS